MSCVNRQGPGEEAGEKNSPPPPSEYSFEEHATSIKFNSGATVAPPAWEDLQRAMAEAEKEKVA